MAENNHFLEDDPAWKAHKPFVEMFSRMTSSLAFVVVREGGYPFLSPDLEKLGYEIPESGWSPDDNLLKSRLHPEDRPVFDESLTRLFNYVTSLPKEVRRDYKYIFEFRVVGRNEELRRVICQLQILDFSLQGNPIELGTIDISPDQTLGRGLRFMLMNYKTGEIVPFAVHEDKDENDSLTKREIEVLKLIDEGMYSKTISERLSISIHTVNRHRQNILEKMNASNAREAVNYARKLGLLA